MCVGDEFHTFDAKGEMLRAVLHKQVQWTQSFMIPAVQITVTLHTNQTTAQCDNEYTHTHIDNYALR